MGAKLPSTKDKEWIVSECSLYTSKAFLSILLRMSEVCASPLVPGRLLKIDTPASTVEATSPCSRVEGIDRLSAAARFCVA